MREALYGSAIRTGFTLRFERIQSTGTEAQLNQHASAGWCIQINLRQGDHDPLTITGCLGPTVEQAKVVDEDVV